MPVLEVRDYSKRGDALPIPNLIEFQLEAYQKFLQKDVPPADRKPEGLEALLREVFPIESYDGNLRLEYVSYDLSEARYTPDECRAVRLTYGMPFRIQVRFKRKDKGEVVEDSIYLGEIPIMIGGGEFIINGAERVIVNQLHRSPGVDFLVEVQEGDRPLHGCRVIPERGSWIECSVTKKDALAVRIDQSSKMSATTFLRALDKKYSTTECQGGADSGRLLRGQPDHRFRKRRGTGQGRRAARRSRRQNPGQQPQERRMRHESQRSADS
jgi:DNA-directed RNA polymerase subunit beta